MMRPHTLDPELAAGFQRAVRGAGHGPRKIAARLSISTKTVEAYREHIRHKLGLKSAAAFMQTVQR